MHEDSKAVTGFVILNKQYCYKRVPFGLKSGAKIFQRLIEKMLEGLNGVFVYVDDIIICGKSKETHNKNLHEVLGRLLKFEVRINFEKSEFFKREISILGYLIKEGLIEIDKSKVNNILNLPEKMNKKGIQKIVGSLNWYRNFIPNFSTKIKPITDLLQDKKQMEWKSDSKKLVEKIIKEINDTSCLRFPDFSSTFVIACDASDFGIGSVMYQAKGPIGYYSKKLSGPEQNYSIVEKEFFAIYKTLIHFRNIIQGYPIRIVTDNKNLTLMKNSTISKRIERWKILLNEFDFELEHVSGKDNQIPDLLSRGKLIWGGDEANMCNLNEYKKLQWEENIASIIFDELNKIKEIDAEVRKEFKNLIKGNQEKIKIENEEIIKKIIRIYHVACGHSGVSTTFNTLRRYFLNENLLKFIQEFVFNCLDCYKCKSNYRKNNKNISINSRQNFEKISMDIYGPLETDIFKEIYTINKIYFLTITDIHSRLSKVYPLRNITSKEVISCIKLWIEEFQKPHSAISDNGRQFISKEIEDFFIRNEIKHILIPEYSPRSNGISERINRTISEIFRIYRGHNLVFIVRIIERRLNLTHNRGIGGIPGEMVNGIIKREEVKNSEIENINPLKVGDMCFVKRFGFSGKIDYLFDGPVRITERGNKGQWFKVEGLKNWQHIKNIKPFKGGSM